MPETRSRLADRSVQSRRVDVRQVKKCESGRRVQTWSSPPVEVPGQRMCQALNDAPTGAKSVFLQVSVPVHDSAATLARRPIFERLVGERLKFGRGASQGWRPVTGTSEGGPEAEPRLR